MEPTTLQRQSELSHDAYVQAEQAFRKLVRKDGGYRNRRPEGEQSRAEADRLAGPDMLNRNISDGWDQQLYVGPRPGSLEETRLANDKRRGVPHP
jgi:hypothetical protein